MHKILKSNKSLRDVVIDVAEIADYLWNAGWAERNAGNITVRVDDYIQREVRELKNYPVFNLKEPYPELNDSYFLVTGTGKRMRDLACDPLNNAALIKLISGGSQYTIICRAPKYTCDFKPTSELPTHLAIHRLINDRGSDERVVVHTHPDELIALTHIRELNNEKKLNSILFGMHPETILVIPKGVGIVQYETPGTQKIADKTIEKFQKYAVVIWEKHGCFAIGREVLDTFDLIDVIVKSARIFFRVKSIGYNPEGLTEHQLLDLAEAFASK